MDQYPTDPLNELLDDDGSQRLGARDSLLLSAQLRIDGSDATVRVRNLSSGGLMAEYAHPIAEGTPVEVDVRGIGWLKGRVAWYTDGRVGIAFDREIDPMAARKPVAAPRRAPVTKPVRRAV